MKIIEHQLECYLLEPTLIHDIRGWFQIPFSIEELHELSIPFNSVYQLNHSYTEYKGVVRGPNYQKRPFDQAKVIRVVRGSVYSVGIDLNPKSKTYGQSCGFFLSEENKHLMYIPRGYAHGFTTLEDGTELEYLTDNQYCYEAAKSFQYDDTTLNNGQGIDWTMSGVVKINKAIRSDKNNLAFPFSECDW